MAASVEKVSLAIGREELEWAREQAERKGTSLSAVLTSAARLARRVEARRTRQQAAWQSFLAWATDGEGLSPEAVRAAADELSRTQR
jgi:hypothetical protein